MGLEEFRQERELLYRNFNPKEMSGDSKGIFAALLTLQLRRKGYTGPMTKFFEELGVSREDVVKWYENLFGEKYFGRKKRVIPRFELEKTDTLTPYEVSRVLKIGLPYIILGIEKGDLPARRENDIYQISPKDMRGYEEFFGVWKPIRTTARLLGVGRKVIERRVDVDMIKHFGKPPYVLVNVNDTRIACNQPIKS